MDGKKWNFDEKAASWDKNPGRVKLANEIAEAVFAEDLVAADMDVLEFGCGTGLLTLRLQPAVRSITGVDSSPGMLAMLEAKIEEQKLTNVRIQLLDTAKGDALQGSYHLVVCSMTLHHVGEVEPLITEFYKITAPYGRLCIADLDPEHGEFHGENETVFHSGFDRQSLRHLIQKSGYTGIRDRTAATVMKPSPSGEIKPFGVFLMTAVKSSEQ